MITETNLDNATLRELLKYFFRSSTVFDAFCLDHFPSIFKRFSSSMDTEQKINIVLAELSREEVLGAIKRNVGQERLDNAIQISRNNALRNSSPSLIRRFRWKIVQNKTAFLSLTSLLLIFFLGDPASWRQQIVPRIKALFITDPAVVLEEAWTDFDNKDYKSSLEKARCVMFMHSSNEMQKRQASLLLSYITESKAKEIVDRDLTRSLTDSTFQNSDKRLRELANSRHLSLNLAATRDSQNGSKNGISSTGSQINPSHSESPDTSSKNLQKDLADVKEQVATTENQIIRMSNEREQLRWQMRNMQIALESMKRDAQHTLMTLSQSESRLNMASFGNSQMNGQTASMQSLIWQMKSEFQGIKSHLEKAVREQDQLMMQTGAIQARLYSSSDTKAVLRVIKPKNHKGLSIESGDTDEVSE